VSTVSRHEVVAAASVKKFRDMILTYNGPKTYEKLREHLLRKLDEKNLKADQLLAQILDDII